MPDLEFDIVDAAPVQYAQAPMLALRLTLSTVQPRQQIQSVILQYQVWIEPAGRQYDEQEQSLLLDIFGKPERWNRTVRSLLWTRNTILVPPFSDHRTVDLDVPCTYDLNVAVAKYFYALKDGTVPLRLMFSGTVFYVPEDSEDGNIQVGQIPLEQEAAYRFPVGIWQEMMERYYPNCHWLCLPRDVFDRFYRFKMQHALTTWEQVVEQLMPANAQEEKL